MIELNSPFLRAQINPRGATLAGLWIRGFDHSLVLGSPDPSAYDGPLLYSGAIVGPVANRIAGARLQIDGTEWQMEANEGSTCLHSGHSGLHAHHWTVAARDAHSVTLQADLKHGDAGLPGHRSIFATYSLSGDTTLTLALRARSDRDTVMNLAHHPYWNLDGENTVSSHYLSVAADTYLPVDADTLPTGDIRKVDDTSHDFRRSRKVPTDRTIDENFCLSRARRDSPEHAATLKGSKGLSLHILTTEPGLQVYNGSGLSRVEKLLHDGRPLHPFAGIALEPQRWPDAPHHPQFAPILLQKDAEYRQETRYRFST